ncbi:hypothetical protein, partial [Klebsiella pneumoniae]
AEQEGQQTETEATGAPQKHHYTLNQQVGSITRLKYVFLAAKIIKTARYVIMKLSENYPYKGVYEKCLV